MCPQHLLSPDTAANPNPDDGDQSEASAAGVVEVTS